MCASIISMPQIINELEYFELEPTTCFGNKILIPISNEKDELKLLYSVNTLGYIKFDS